MGRQLPLQSARRQLHRGRGLGERGRPARESRQEGRLDSLGKAAFQPRLFLQEPQVLLDDDVEALVGGLNRLIEHRTLENDLVRGAAEQGLRAEDPLVLGEKRLRRLRRLQVHGLRAPRQPQDLAQQEHVECGRHVAVVARQRQGAGADAVQHVRMRAVDNEFAGVAVLEYPSIAHQSAQRRADVVGGQQRKAEEPQIAEIEVLPHVQPEVRVAHRQGGGIQEGEEVAQGDPRASGVDVLALPSEPGVQRPGIAAATGQVTAGRRDEARVDRGLRAPQNGLHGHWMPNFRCRASIRRIAIAIY